MAVKTGSEYRKIILLCCSVYFVSYITRLNYNSCLSEIIATGVLSKGAAGTINMVSFISYGCGQILFGILADKFSPIRMIAVGLGGTALMNALFPIWGNEALLCVIWGVNSMFQSILWPPIIKLMAVSLPKEKYKKGITQILFASLAATVFTYMLAGVLIKLSAWRLIFWIGSVSAAILSGLWYSKMKNTNAAVCTGFDDINNKDNENKFGNGRIIIAFFIAVGLVSTVQGFLRDGINTWMTTYISEVFSVSTSNSTFTAILLPMFSLLAINAVYLLYKKTKSELLSTFILYALGCLAALMLAVFSLTSAGISIFSMTIISGCMTGINTLIISYLPSRPEFMSRAATLSGVMNACTYLGSALSSFSLGFAVEAFGWGVFSVIIAFAAASGLLTAVLAIKIRKRM